MTKPTTIVQTPPAMAQQKQKPLPVQCSWCGKVFTEGGDMDCGARVPAHIARGPDGAWCKTDDIVKVLEGPKP